MSRSNDEVFWNDLSEVMLTKQPQIPKNTYTFHQVVPYLYPKALDHPIMMKKRKSIQMENEKTKNPLEVL